MPYQQEVALESMRLQELSQILENTFSCITNSLRIYQYILGVLTTLISLSSDPVNSKPFLSVIALTLP